MPLIYWMAGVPPAVFSFPWERSASTSIDNCRQPSIEIDVLLPSLA